MHGAEARFGIPAIIADRAERTPDGVAIRDGARTLTWSELVQGAAAVARRLAALGVAAERPVAVLGPRSPERIIAALATWRAGGAHVPLDPAWPPARIAAILADLGAATLIGPSGTEAFAGPSCQFLDIDAALKEAAPDAPAPALREVDPAALAYVIYTSGSTGQPKGVEITHDNLRHLIAWHNSAFAVGAADRASHLAGLGFDASIWEIWPHLCAGATLVLAPEPVRSSPDALVRWIVDAGITITFVPTVLAEPLIARSWPADTALRLLLTGGEALRRRPIPGLPFRVINNYGPTECTVLATSGEVLPAHEPPDLEPPSLGRPIAATTIALIGPNDAPVADGETGEIIIAGAGVGRGYRNLPALSAERFAGRRFRTGDLGCRLTSGEIAFRGRLDDQIKLRGHRIAPEEIVAVLNRHNLVQASAVVARAQPAGELRLLAYILPTGTEAPGAAELRALLARHLPEPMVPAAFIRVDRWPLTPSGKLDRDALPGPSAENLLPHARYRAPSHPAEQRLAEIVGELLGIDNVGVDDSFFLLGGHSLLGTQLVMQANDAFGVPLTLRHLFEAQTVARLAEVVEALVIAELAQEPEPQQAG